MYPVPVFNKIWDVDFKTHLWAELIIRTWLVSNRKAFKSAWRVRQFYFLIYCFLNIVRFYFMYVRAMAVYALVHSVFARQGFHFQCFK